MPKKIVAVSYRDHTLISITALAHVVGQSRRTVEMWARTEAMPVAVRGGGRGNPTLISLEEWLPWYEQRTDRAGLKASRARLAAAQADKAELEFSLLAGTTLRVEDIESRWANMVTRARAKALALIHRLPGAIRATDYSHMAIRAAVKELIYEFLAELSRYDGSAVADDELDDPDDDDLRDQRRGLGR